MKTFDYLLDIRERKGAGFLLLLDPDKLAQENTGDIVRHAQDSGVDAFLVGSSLMTRDTFESSLGEIKKHAKVPVIIFPGSLFQISGRADAILFLSALASKNTDLIVGNHVHAAPLIRQHNLETISTAYLLIESGKLTTAHFMSDSLPIPRDKAEIAAAFALAADMFGFQMVYLEAGSGALSNVPKEMVHAVSKTVRMPVVVGGGIKNPDTAHELASAGASFIVTGNFFESNGNSSKLKEFAGAIHIKQTQGVTV
ncbi:MAG: geranylgeranylglyceryl/heptaprenylglyceryl phosphate synthase [Bacteroidetes bacterium]|nr:geranylgeranylglyceryl/heptaprenylglyceryl phosphate synthase [Bacteroidota bacterium]